MGMIFEDREGAAPTVNRTVPTQVLNTQPSLVDQLTNQINQGTYQYGAIGDAFRAGDLTEGQKDSLASLYYSSPVSRTDSNLQARQETWQDLGRTAPTLDPLDIVNTPSTGMLTNTQPVKDYSGMSWEQLEEQRLAGDNFGLSQDFVDSDLAARQTFADQQSFQFGIGEDMSGYDKEYVGTDTANQREMSSQGLLSGALDAGTAQRLDELGLQAEYKQDEFRGYKYNTNTGQYDYYDNRKSMLEQAAPALIKNAIVGVATAGLGSAISTGLGVSSTTGAAIASGAASAAQGGDLDEILVSAVTAGLAEEAKAASELAEAAGATKEAIAYADTIKQLNTAVKLGEAVSNKDVIGTLSSGLELAGVGSLVDYTEDFIAESLGETAGMGVDGAFTEWAFYNSDHIAEASVKFADTLIREGNLGEAGKDAVMKYIRDGGGIEDLFPEGGDFAIDWEVPEAVQQVAQLIADGASAVNRVIIKPAVETAAAIGSAANEVVDAGIRAIPVTKEEAEQFVKDTKEAVAPAVEVVRNTGRQAEEVYGTVEDFVKEEVAPAVRETGRDIRETVDPVANVVRDTGRQAEELYGQAEDYVKEEVAPAVRQVGRDIREAVPEVDLGFNTPDFSELSMSLTGGSGGYTGGYSGGNADLSALAKMRTKYGDQFVFEDLLTNPLLKNRFIS